MWSQFRTWMAAIPLADPLRREQAATLQSLIFVLIAASLIGVPLSLSATSQVDQLVGIVSSLVQALLLIVAAVVLRRGQFSAAVALVIVSTILFAALNMIPTGLEGSRAVFTALAIPIVLAGLLGGRRLLAFASALTVILVIGMAVFSSIAPTLVGYSHQTYDPRLTSVVYVIVAIVLTVLIDRFGRALQTALAQARTRERELDALRMSLEQQIKERTAALQATVDQLSASQTTITLLGAPMLPVLPGVLVAPLIGLFDSARAAALSQKILAAIANQRADDRHLRHYRGGGGRSTHHRGAAAAGRGGATAGRGAGDRRRTPRGGHRPGRAGDRPECEGFSIRPFSTSSATATLRARDCDHHVIEELL